MKRFTQFLIVAVMGTCAIKAQNIHFSDVNFKAAIIKAYPTLDANKDGEISQSEAETLTVIRNLSNYPNVYDATGIEGFTNLTELNLGNLINLNKIEVKNLLKLTTLNLRANKLTGTLDISTLSNLTNLELNNNQLTGVIFPQDSKLKIVYINDNALTSIDLSELKDLQRIFLVNNKLDALSFTQNLNLERIHINGNLLKNLDVSGLTKLNWFSAESNQLEQIKFSNNPLLKTILAKNNVLTNFDFMDGVDNNITLINVEGNPNFAKLKKDCNDLIVTVVNTSVEDNCNDLSSQNYQKSEIKIYPTLAKDFINVRSNFKLGNYKIFDFSGRLLLSGNIEKSNKIDINNLENGIYYLTLNVGESVVTQRFVKQ